MIKSREEKTKKELFEALLRLVKFQLKSLQEKEPEQTKKPEVSFGKRFLVWFLAGSLFVAFGVLADYASTQKEDAGAYRKWKENIEQAIRQEAARKASGLDCKSPPTCPNDVDAILKRMDEADKNASAIAAAHAREKNDTADTKKKGCSLPDWLVGKLWFALLILCWIVEALTALVMLEGVLRIAVWFGQWLGLLDERKWEGFNDKLLDRIADAAKEGSTAAAWLPLMAAVTAAGSIVYVSLPAPYWHPGEQKISPIAIRIEPDHLTVTPDPLTVEVKPPRIQVDVNGNAGNILGELEALKQAVGTVNQSVHAGAAGAVATTAQLAASIENLKASVLALDMVQHASADGYVHSDPFTQAKCSELIFARQRGGDELTSFLWRMGLRSSRPQRGDLKEYADSIITIFCAASQPSVGTETAFNRER